MKLKNERGVTLIALTVTVIILLVITGTILYNTKNQVLIKKINNLYIDIDAISARVDDYYIDYGELPVICEYISQNDLIDLLRDNANAKSAELSYESVINPNDNDKYYVIDLEKLESLTVTYGYDDEYKTIKTNRNITLSNIEDEIYIINELTHQIYFPHGIFVDDVMYYTNYDGEFSVVNVEYPQE